VVANARFGAVAAGEAVGMKLAEDSTRTVHSLGLEDLSMAVRYRRYLYELLEPYLGDSVLEVGAGLGDFAAQLAGRRRLVVTDSDPFCVWSLRERLGDRPEVEVRALDLQGEATIGAPVESVVAINVLEHLEDDEHALAAMRSVVVPGGRVLLLVPGYPALYGEFDLAVGHLRRYTPAALRHAVEAAGLHVVGGGARRRPVAADARPGQAVRPRRRAAGPRPGATLRAALRPVGALRRQRAVRLGRARR
jgi:SAM-dependent methyltransferase